MPSLEIDLSGWTRLEGAIEGMEKRAKDLTPVMEPATAGLDTVLQDSFRLSASPFGIPWKPLKESTVARRRQHSSKPLIDTGALRMSTHAKREGKRSVVFGTSGAAATYAGTHQQGRGKIPARPFLPLVNGHVSVEGGRVGKWWERTRKMVINYLLKGTLT